MNSGQLETNPNSKYRKSVLFVCLGNICRSPAAEGVFRSVVKKSGLSDQLKIDSCGTGGGSSNWFKEGGFSYHEGDPPDPRMADAASRRGIPLTSRSRPLRPTDFDDFDLIVHMDDSNRMEILRAANYWRIPPEKTAKVKSMMSFAPDAHLKYVPDPYYGGSDGFEKVLDLLGAASQGLLASLGPPGEQ